ncbi:MAG: penicillin acylase family protein [Acidobacteriota bacterium]|nr:penicillin acylase family protein [Acidobacteriota bacterium]
MNLNSTPPAQDESLSSLQLLRRRIFLRTAALLGSLAVLVVIAGFLLARHWVRETLANSLPQIDGSVLLAGLSAPVTVERDMHGVPHLRAASPDDLVLAQGYVTAQDRLWQMDALRRHAAGELAEILGSGLIAHDRTQRILQLRASADHALAALAPEQIHLLQRYADGVNASIAVQRAHLPLEFRLLRYQPAPWTPRDSILIGLVMFQDLTNSFPQELNREALTARLPAHLIADLYPTMSWRDHPPTETPIDPTAPQTDIPDIPLDESQTRLREPARSKVVPAELIAAEKALGPVLSSAPECDGCRAGSNNWVVAGAHTASGKPLLSNDMHLNHNVPGIWYEADLESASAGGEFHVTGVSLPGVPFIIVGHNEHVAWGFTNLGAEVQDVYIEHVRGAGGGAEYEAADGTWHGVRHQQEVIHVKGGKDVLLDVQSTQHGASATPVISALFPSEARTLSLRWTIYDPAAITPSFEAIDAAKDGAGLVAAFSQFGGPAQNLVYADDQGHIGYHAVGMIPVRGSVANPSPISPVPGDARDPKQDWAGYIPYDKLPQAADPASGFLATANARVTPDDYTYPITLNWAAPYRNERIWKLLADRASASHDHLTPADMLRIQTDVYSDVDHVIAQRLAYAIDHAARPELVGDKRLHQAADLLREWDGNVAMDAAAPAIVDATRTALWAVLINSQAEAYAETTSKQKPSARSENVAALYTWGNKAYAEEWMIMHTPARWLPARYANWDDLLAGAVAVAMRESHSPYEVAKWRYGTFRPLDIEHPVYSQSALLERLIGRPTGTGVVPQSGDDTTVKQVGRTFGPSERFTADLADFDRSTLNLVLGESANPDSPWFMDQWAAWYGGTTFALPFSPAAVRASATHTLTLRAR